MIKISFAAFAALLLAGGFSTAVFAQAPPPGQPYIQVPIPGMPGFGQQPPEQRGYQGGDDRERREHCERLSPLRTDSCQLVSKICWCVKTFGEMMDAPKWLEPTGFFCFAPACAGRFGRM